MSPELRLRSGCNADGDGVAALMQAAFAEYPGCVFDRAGEIPELDALGDYFHARGGAYWVLADDADTVFGCIGLVSQRDPAGQRGELRKLYLAAALRGTGWATRLLAAAESEARRRAHGAVELWTDTRFTRAHRFYQKHGYVTSGRARALHDLSATREWHYHKTLTAEARR